MNEMNRKVIEEFRTNQGRVGGFFDGMPILILHTTGAKSGTERINPMAYLDLDGRRFVFASKGGADMNPDWFLNLRTNPEVKVEVGTTTYSATATPLSGDERTRIYAEQATRYPGFAEYEEKTSRVIPVVEITPKI